MGRQFFTADTDLPQAQRHEARPDRHHHKHANLDRHPHGRGPGTQPQDVGGVEHAGTGRDREPPAEGQKQRRAGDDQDVEGGELRIPAAGDMHNGGDQPQIYGALQAVKHRTVRAPFDLAVHGRGNGRDRRHGEHERRDERIAGLSAVPDEDGGHENRARQHDTP